MNELINKLDFDHALKERLISLYKSKNDKIDSAAMNCKERGFKSLMFKDDLFRLAVCLRYAEFTKQFYIDKGIPLDIYYDTMRDITVWCENNKNMGLKNYNWIKNHLKGDLFKIGRLQFQLFNCKNPTLKYDYLPFDYGDNLIYVHIPQGEKLIFSDCVDSLLRAKRFFEEYFLDFKYEFFFCESWLLYNENWRFMQTDCNILQFQSLFNIVYSNDDDRQAIERIFGKRRLLKSNYPQTTSLQINAKAFMQNGNKMGIGIGIIPKNEI